ncbi:fibronectin type III domain-containing protein [Sulfurimonas sp.]
MKLLNLSILCTVSLLVLSGCNASAPKPADKAAVDATLPVITLTKKGIIADMKSIAFEWKSIKDPRVIGMYIYKRTPKDKDQSKLEYYDTISSRFKTHYVDTHVEPSTRYSYAFKTFSKDAEGELSPIYNVNTLPVLQSVSWIHSIAGLPRSAKIIWRPHVSERVKAYIIERKTFEDSKWKRIDEIEGRLNAEYIDADLEDNHVYLYRIRVVTFDGLISTPSQVVKVVTKSLPKSVKNIKVSKNLPKKIEISWSVNKPKDFAHFNLYRGKDIDSSFELIAQLQKSKFIDKINEDGKVYFYRVSVVDKDALESENEKKSVMGMTLKKPKAPVILESKFNGSSVFIDWNDGDHRIKEYVVVRKHKQGWFEEKIKEFKNIKHTRFIDKGLMPDSTYTYIVYGADKYGIVSNPSSEVVIITPESNKIVQAPKNQSKTTDVIQKTTTKQQSKELVQPATDLDLNEI